jgi:two-component system NtrC family sensor kinase
MRFPLSLKVTVPLILLGFAAILSAVNLLYHVPQAERAAEEDGRKRLAQEMSRLQSTLEYLLLKGDVTAAEHEIAVLAHNHDVTIAALTDDRNAVIASTRRAWLGQQIADVLPQFDPENDDGRSIRERHAGMTIDSNSDELLGHAGILMGSERRNCVLLEPAACS